MLEHIFINLNLCCIQWYKFGVCRGKGSRDAVTQFTHVHQNHEYFTAHKVTYAHQNHKAWLTSQVYSSKSNRGFIFRKHRNRSLMWCKSGLDSTLCSCTTCMGTWISPISEAWSWTWLLQCSHIPTGTVKAVLTGMWTLDHLNTHVLKDRSFAWTQLGTDGAKICRLAQLFCCMTTA